MAEREQHINPESDEGYYADTPRGIFTADGTWYHTTESLLREYAGAVLAHEPLTRLLKQTDEWLRLPESLTLLVLPMLLIALPWGAAALLTALFFIAWSVIGPSVTSRVVVPVVRVLNSVWFQAFYYVFLLSFISAYDRYGAVIVGLVGFALIRWGLLKKLLRPIVRPLHTALYRLPAPDQVLRGFIIRAALKYRLSLPELDRMEEAIVDRWSSRS